MYKRNLLCDVLPLFLKLYTFTLTECPHAEKLIGNVWHGMRSVITAYVLVMNGDIAFVRHVPMLNVVRAMSLHPDTLQYIRFNHRANIFQGCDRSYAHLGESWRLGGAAMSEARHLWREVSYEGIPFMRTVCYSDMAFIVDSAFGRNRIFQLAWTKRHNKTYDASSPELTLLREIALDPRAWGTHIFGEQGAMATTAHLDGRHTSGIEVRGVRDSTAATNRSHGRVRGDRDLNFQTPHPDPQT